MINAKLVGIIIYDSGFAYFNSHVIPRMIRVAIVQ